MSGELDAWAAAGRTATLWWRDDDAVAPTRALDTLIAHGERHGVPLCLAVIPARAEPALATRIAESAQVAVAVHGYDHVNRAAPGERKCELCPSRDPEEAAAELSAGRARLTELFGEQAIALLVPPWNRIAAAAVPHLPAVGFAGLSALGPRASALPAPGLVAVNTHADIIDWKVRRFIGTATASERLVRHLQSRRLGTADADEPTGLLTHHLVHDGAAWAFLEHLFALTREHGATRWISAAQIFNVPS